MEIGEHVKEGYSCEIWISLTNGEYHVKLHPKLTDALR